MADTLSMTVIPRLVHLFFPFLQYGVGINTLAERSINDFLVNALNISPEYVESRIQTVFLDGRAVDDLDSTVLGHGSTLALSGAMPGLVGATLRKKGAYASLRRAITLAGKGASDPSRSGVIILKLFNLLVPELGPALLARGVWIHATDLDRFFRERDEAFWGGLQSVAVNGRQTDSAAFKKIDWSLHRERVLLRLSAA